MYHCVYVCVYTYRERTQSQTLSHAGKRPFLTRHIHAVSVSELISQNPQYVDMVTCSSFTPSSWPLEIDCPPDS
ncbi:hypothetical protein XELAEV_18040024mg [Xenopus laevis]|uniref:Uncharacterized protein n=1 Tax=Xenopus laevis TaxID=8355 RepID=A0A974C9R6_XENLA|nr:hypothetical protein XELAEV_18040024mg [Xenopus laevis]